MLSDNVTCADVSPTLPTSLPVALVAPVGSIFSDIDKSDMSDSASDCDPETRFFFRSIINSGDVSSRFLDNVLITYMKFL